jgi:hypothetical protein
LLRQKNDQVNKEELTRVAKREVLTGGKGRWGGRKGGEGRRKGERGGEGRAPPGLPPLNSSNELMGRLGKMGLPQTTFVGCW